MKVTPFVTPFYPVNWGYVGTFNYIGFEDGQEGICVLQTSQVYSKAAINGATAAVFTKDMWQV